MSHLIQKDLRFFGDGFGAMVKGKEGRGGGGRVLYVPLVPRFEGAVVGTKQISISHKMLKWLGPS